jgi:hypothetical protein
MNSPINWKTTSILRLFLWIYGDSDDYLETHHRNGNHNDNTLANLVLLHGHFHDEVHRTKYS